MLVDGELSADLRPDHKLVAVERLKAYIRWIRTSQWHGL
jgi:hypothetical protein